MEIYVDPVRIWLLGVFPAILLAIFLLSQTLYIGWRKMLVRSNPMIHATVYLLVVQLIYVSGNYSAAGFFLFPADKIIRLVHFNKFTGLISLILVCALWGWFLSRVHCWLWSAVSRWNSPSNLADRIAMICAVIMCIAWLRYLVVYPLLAVPSLYLPLSIHQHAFALDILMINWLFPLFLLGVVSSLISTHKLRLFSINLVYVLGVGVLIPITSALT